MRASFTLAFGTGAMALLLAGCTGTNEDATDSGAEATENTAVGLDYAIKMSCDPGAPAGTIQTAGKVYKISYDSSVTEIQVSAIGAKGDGSNGGNGGGIKATTKAPASWGGSVFAHVGCYGGGKYTNGSGGGWPNGGGDKYAGGGSTALTQTSEFTPIVVAGAGGGSDYSDHQGGSCCDQSGNGADGAGDGDPKPGGGTQSKGGVGGNKPSGTGHRDGGDGKYGIGGDGAKGDDYDGGGGGGGYYGGGGGMGSALFYTSNSAGGAGSSYASADVSEHQFFPPSPVPEYGSLELTFVCGEAPCKTQPKPTPVG